MLALVKFEKHLINRKCKRGLLKISCKALIVWLSVQFKQISNFSDLSLLIAIVNNASSWIVLEDKPWAL